MGRQTKLWNPGSSWDTKAPMLLHLDVLFRAIVTNEVCIDILVHNIPRFRRTAEGVSIWRQRTRLTYGSSVDPSCLDYQYSMQQKSHVGAWLHRQRGRFGVMMNPAVGGGRVIGQRDPKYTGGSNLRADTTLHGLKLPLKPEAN